MLNYSDWGGIMNKKLRGITGIVTVMLLAIGATLAASPAYAGDWYWGYKSCLPMGMHTSTWSNGSGTVTHTMDTGVGGYVANTWNNGIATIAHRHTPGFSQTPRATVAGASTTSATFSCV